LGGFSRAGTFEGISRSVGLGGGGAICMWESLLGRDGLAGEESGRGVLGIDGEDGITKDGPGSEDIVEW